MLPGVRSSSVERGFGRVRLRGASEVLRVNCSTAAVRSEIVLGPGGREGPQTAPNRTKMGHHIPLRLLVSGHRASSPLPFCLVFLSVSER